MTITIDEISTEMPEPEVEKQVGEFEIEIGTQKDKEGNVKIPDNTDELVELIKANVEHNCNKMLQFCTKLLAEDFNKKIEEYKSQITNLTDDNKSLLEDNKKYKEQIERSKTHIKDHFTITYENDDD